MKVRTWLTCVVVVSVLTACGGGGGSVPPPDAVSGTLQQVSGTLAIGSSTATLASGSRAPAFVSPATKHAALFIDGATAASGTTACTNSGTAGGVGTVACTIAWSAALAVPASHAFAVEIDNGPAATPANTVLAEGRGTYAIVAGNGNVLSTLTLNGTVASANYSVTSCTATACSGNVQIGGPADNAVTYVGSVTVPAAGNNPSTGTVYDNGNVTFVSSNAAAGTGGLITGTAQTSGANVYSTYAASTLTVGGVSTTGVYTYQVTCNASATGSFGITATIVGTRSSDVTAGELAALSPAVVYPTTLTILTTAPSFTCTSGEIGDATGTIPVN